MSILIPPYDIVTRFEKDDITLKACYNRVMSSDQEVTVEFKVPGTYGVDAGRKLVGGEAWFSSDHSDDHITSIVVVDKDNVTGLGVGAILRSYVDSDVPNYQTGGWYLGHGKAVINAITGIASIPAGLYVRIQAVKGGETDEFFTVNMKWGEPEGT